MANNKIKISCLRILGIVDNPYQLLLIQGLQSDERLIVKTGFANRFWGIIKTAMIQKPDYIHFDWITSYYYRRSLWMTIVSIPLLMLQVYIARYVFKCKLVWTAHNIIPHDSNYLKLHRFCRRFFARNMEWIRVFSELTVADAAKEFKCNANKFKVIPEGSYVEFYSNKVSRMEARKYLNIANDKMVLLYMGFLKPYKGIIELMEGFKNNFDNNSVLIIAGKAIDETFLETIKKTVSENTILVDRFIADDELQYFFNAADVVTLPFNKIENSGSVILAMGFKKPVIAPDMGALTDRLKNQPELLYKKSLEESFEVLKKMNPEELTQIGEKNYQELSEYKWNDFAKAF